MRKFLLALVLLLGVVFLITRLAEVQEIVETLRRGDWRFLAIALGVTAAWFVNLAALLKTIYRAMGIRERIRDLIPVVAASNFVNIVAPSAGMSGLVVFISAARRRGYSPARAAVAGALTVLFDYAAFLCVLGLGLIVLFRRNNLGVPELVASSLLLAIAVVLAGLIYLGTQSANSLGRALAWMGRQVNRALWPFIHREYLSESRAYEFAHEAMDGLQELTRQPKMLVASLGLALTKQALLISILMLCFFAFKVELSIGTLIAGFAIAYLFMIISPTPVGMGVVEGMLTITLSSMYVPIGAAAVITLAYRGFTFWIPLLFSMLAFRWLGGTRGLARDAARRTAGHHTAPGGGQD